MANGKRLRFSEGMSTSDFMLTILVVTFLLPIVILLIRGCLRFGKVLEGIMGKLDDYGEYSLRFCAFYDHESMTVITGQQVC